jgi:hypothetical protein
MHLSCPLRFARAEAPALNLPRSYSRTAAWNNYTDEFREKAIKDPQKDGSTAKEFFELAPLAFSDFWCMRGRPESGLGQRGLIRTSTAPDFAITGHREIVRLTFQAHELSGPGS